MIGSRREAMRAGASAVLALLRRDLLAGGRAASLRIARALAIVVSGAAVLVAYSATRAGYASEAALTATVFIFGMLSLIAALSAPQAAISALRRERDAGMLDLLVMAGLTPARLALGRILSTFANLLSILLATLPALALLAFFGRPTASELLACSGIEACGWLALSSFAVAVSAWARSTAAAAMLAVGGLIGWSILVAIAQYKGVALSASMLLAEALGAGPSQGALAIHLVHYLSAQIGIAALGWGVAVVGIRRGLRGAKPVRGERATPAVVGAPVPRAAPRPTWLQRIAPRPPPLRDAWPLTWLLQRRSADARPRTFALLLLIPPLAFMWKGEDGLLVALWGLALIALPMALLVPALHVSSSRERHQWDSLMGTALDGPRAVIDLVRATLLASAMPAAACVLAILLAGLVGLDSATLARSVAVVPAFLATWVVLALLGTAAGLIARSSAGAVRVGAWTLLLVAAGPFITLGCALLFHERALDGYSWAYAILVVALAVASIAGLTRMQARNGGRAVLLAVPSTWAFIVAPMFMIGDMDTGPMFGAGGIAGMMALTLKLESPGSHDFPEVPLLLAVPHAVLAMMLLVALMRRADRWLGRPG